MATKEPPSPLKLSPIEVAIQQAKQSKDEVVAKIEEDSKTLFQLAQEQLAADFMAAKYVPQRKMVHSDNLSDNTKPGAVKKVVKGDGYSGTHETITPDVPVNEANLITSECQNGMHAPVIDFDVPIESYPSSHIGHNHLYINKEMSWEDYQKLLGVLVEVGLVEEGYAKAAKAKGFTAVRLPGTYKENAPRSVYVLAENAVLRQNTYELMRQVESLELRLAEETDPALVAEYQLLYDNSVQLIELNNQLSAEVEALKQDLNAVKLEAAATQKATWT